jgi:hypothetical protein
MPVTEAILASNPPSYRTIMELDQKIRAFDIPSSSPLDPQRPSTSMQAFVRSHYSELSTSSRRASTSVGTDSQPRAP